MKKHITSLIIIIFFLGFFFYGFSGKNLLNDEWALSVNGEKITSDSFTKELSHEIKFFSYQSQFNITSDYLKLLVAHIKEKFINDLLIKNLINDMGIEIYPEDVVYEIKKQEYFHNKNGEFDELKFHEILSSHEMNESEYADKIEQMLYKKMLFEAIFVKKIENNLIENAYLIYDTHERILDILEIQKPNLHEDINEEKLKNFYKNNQESFVNDEYRNFSYIKITPEIIKNVKCSVEEIENEFQINNAKYKKNFQSFDLTNIIFQNKDDANYWKNLLEDNFKENIKKISDHEEINIANLNNINFANVNVTLKQAIESLNLNELSDVIETSLGFHVLRLININEPDNINELIRNDIEEKITEFKKMERFYELLNDINSDINEKNDIAKIALKFNLPINKVDFLNKKGKNTEYIDLELPNIKNLIANVFSLQKNQISDLLINDDDSDHCFFINVDEIIEKKQLDFSEVRDLVKIEWENEQINSLYEKNSNIIFKNLQEENDLNNVPEEIKFNIKYNQKWTLKNENKLDEKLHEIALDLNNEKRVSNPILINDHYYILHLQDIIIKELSDSEREEQLNELFPQMTDDWNQFIYNILLDHAKKKFKVKINEKYFQKFENL